MLEGNPMLALPLCERVTIVSALVMLHGSASAADSAAGTKAPRQAGVPVQVTEEMTGAGIVSSGVTLPAIPPVSGSRDKPVPSWGKPLPYPIVIADRRNNRLIEIAPDKQVIWEFPSPNLKIYRGNDDVFVSPDGKKLMVNEEDNYDIHIIDYATRQIEWSYGIPDTRGSAPGLFNYPDDAHLLADGTVEKGFEPTCVASSFARPSTATANPTGPTKCEASSATFRGRLQA